MDDPRLTAQRLAQALAQPVRADTALIECGGRVGLAYSEGEELVRHADAALCSAKAHGKGQWAEYRPDEG